MRSIALFCKAKRSFACPFKAYIYTFINLKPNILLLFNKITPLQYYIYTNNLNIWRWISRNEMGALRALARRPEGPPAPILFREIHRH